MPILFFMQGPGPNQALAGQGIASGEAFGSDTLTQGSGSGQNLAGTGIASAEAFGSDTLTQGSGSGQNLAGTGISSAEAFGSDTLIQGNGSNQNLAGTGISSGEAFGAGGLSQGGALQSLTGQGLVSGEAFGSDKLGQGSPGAGQSLAGTGIGTGEAFGNSSVGTASLLIIHPLTLGVYTDRLPLGTVLANGSYVTVYQGDQISIYGQVTTAVGTLLITAQPTWKVYDSLGFGGIESALPVNSYDSSALVTVSVQIFVDTSLLPTGLFTVQIPILLRDGNNPFATVTKTLIEIVLNVVNPLA